MPELSPPLHSNWQTKEHQPSNIHRVDASQQLCWRGCKDQPPNDCKLSVKKSRKLLFLLLTVCYCFSSLKDRTRPRLFEKKTREVAWKWSHLRMATHWKDSAHEKKSSHKAPLWSSDKLEKLQEESQLKTLTEFPYFEQPKEPLIGRL